MTIEIGATVMTPITDLEGEISYVFGELIDINSRFAKVKTSEGEIIRVGKTKIELVKHEVKQPVAKNNKTTKQSFDSCPKCNSENIKTISQRISDGEKAENIELDHRCGDCDEEFGNILNTRRKMRINHNEWKYSQCVSYSGRKSCDNADDVAKTLRGMALPDVYKKVAEIIGADPVVLEQGYRHLNNGQQRMCLGNKMRGFLRKQNAK